jgi:hypothetical protein
MKPTNKDGLNFINWKFKMQTLMEGYGIWTIAKGDEMRPYAAAVHDKDNNPRLG